MTTLFLATTGGHLAQLNDLSHRVPPNGAAVWVTHENAQSTSLLAERDVHFVPYVGVRNVPDVLRCIPLARRLMNSRNITRAVSTGSGIALGYLPYLASRGVECHYIESAARVDGPSLTGRLLQWVPGIRLHTQYQHWARPRWHYAGSVLDGFEAVHGARPPGDPVRVVVTVGTATEYPFRRVFAHLAPLLAPGGPLERAVHARLDVLWQTGITPVDDLPIRPTPFLPATQLIAALQAADIVVSHTGTGSVLATLEGGRFPLLVTRDRAHGEAGDNHQLELAAELSRRGLGLHREIESITVNELRATMATTVRRTASPPPLDFDR